MNRHIKGFAVATVLVLFTLLFFLMTATTLGHAAVSSTKHNLSVSGPGTVKAGSEAEICVFCHAPHNTSPSGQLWNRRDGTTYIPYTSSTSKSIAGQPNGASMLCLSCHDGTIALGEVRNRVSPISTTGGVTTMPAGNTLLGTDLSDDHPVSFIFDATLQAARGELVAPSTLVKPSKVRLDASGRLQCTACHDPHDDTNKKFLVINNTASALCQTCHLKNYWASSDHKNSTKTWNGVAPNPWPHTIGTTVAVNACENCHRPHTSGSGTRLLNYAAEEANCLSCHNGNVATKNIQAEFNKSSAHHVANYTGIHDPTEPASVATSHVECADCHNPHAVNATAGSVPGGSANPALPGSQIGVRGVGISGLEVNPATAEYEICFRCHADGAGNTPAPSTPRVIARSNKRLQFQTTNSSFHPIAGTGKNTAVPSLVAGWTTSSRVKCTDCHNNNAGLYSSGTPSAPTGTGPNGPHGSTKPSLLERTYSAGFIVESAANHALCYKCHSQTSILANNSFPLHNYHLKQVGNPVPCGACHDPHGVDSVSPNNRNLLNFDTSKVTQFGTEPIRWESTGVRHGRCYLVCHMPNGNNITHNATTKTY